MLYRKVFGERRLTETEQELVSQNKIEKGTCTMFREYRAN